MLNPSTADASVDDPTIRRCIQFARGLDCGGLEVVNLFAWRATHPSTMEAAANRGENIIGPENDGEILDAARRARVVIAAWGARPFARSRGDVVLGMLAPLADVYALHKTSEGAPGHPLYLPKDAALSMFQGMRSVRENVEFNDAAR